MYSGPSRIKIDKTEHEMGNSRGNKRYKNVLSPNQKHVKLSTTT
jgi:hypothetical protein